MFSSRKHFWTINFSVNNFLISNQWNLFIKSTTPVFSCFSLFLFLFSNVYYTVRIQSNFFLQFYFLCLFNILRSAVNNLFAFLCPPGYVISQKIFLLFQKIKLYDIPSFANRKTFPYHLSINDNVVHWNKLISWPQSHKIFNILQQLHHTSNSAN